MLVLQYCLWAESGWLPRSVRRKVAMLLAFIVGFLEKAYKNFFSKNFTLIRVDFLGVLFVEEGLGGGGVNHPSA